MEAFNTFLKGAHLDLEAISQPEGTYRTLVNAVRTLDGAISNEKGTTSVVTLPTGLDILGQCVLNNEIIVFLCNSGSTTSEIGIISSTNTYASKLSSRSGSGGVVTTNSQLTFNYAKRIYAEARIDYRGHRIVYFVDDNNTNRRLDLDDVPTTDIADQLALQLDYQIPVCQLNSVTEAGSLPTGVYQFAARLTTTTGNRTPFGFVSTTIPIVDEVRSLGRNSFDGALPQSESTKAIHIDVVNIDTNYDQVEIVAMTYTGVGNQLSIWTLEPIAIEGRSSLTVTYSSLAQNINEVTLNELVQEMDVYDKAKHIAQKDNRLLLAGLSKNAVPDFQAIANATTIKYVVKEMLYTEGVGGNFADYKDEKNSSTLVGHQREEVYSYALVPIFLNGTVGNAYHIPAPSRGSDRRYAANTTTKVLGTYNSDLTYPTGRGYPTGRIRYHVMPTAAQEPTYTNTSGQLAIRVLGIEVNVPDSVLTASIKAKLAGWAIVRQQRTDSDRTILAQGIVIPAMLGNNQPATGIVGTSATRYEVASFMGNTSWSQVTSPEAIQSTLGLFYSPDTIITTPTTTPAKIKAVQGILGVTTILRDSHGDGQMYAWVDYNNTHTDSKGSAASLVTATSIDPEFIGTVSSNFGLGTTAFSSHYSEGGYLFKTSEAIHRTSKKDIQLRSSFNPYADSMNDDIDFRLTNDGTTFATQATGKSWTFLYNLYNEPTSLYGAVTSAKYILSGVKLYGVSQKSLYTGTTETSQERLHVFGGDTFISRFSFRSSNNFRELKRGQGVDDHGSARILAYFFVESQINCNYRHYIEPTEVDGEEVEGTVPYYPKYSTLYVGDGTGLIELLPNLGHATGYNKQYSIENTLKGYFPKGLNEEEVLSFDNRVIYSELAIESEQLDAYRLFLVNNYHDVPKNKGALTDIFIHGGSLYLQTANTLFKAYMNEQTTQATSSGDVVLGNGGLFPLPSKEIFTISGGYAGTLSKRANMNTPHGRFMVDNKQGKVFLFTDQLAEISAQGTFNYFRERLIGTDETTSISSGYDYINKRWLLTSNNATTSKAFTVSYSPELSSWSSAHTYYPDLYINRSSSLYLSKKANYNFYELGTGSYGVYFGAAPAGVILEFVINVDASTTKVFDNVYLHTMVKDSTNLQKNWVTFTSCQFYNAHQNTGPLNITIANNFEADMQNLSFTQVLGKPKGGEIRIAIPRDLVANSNSDIFAATNLLSHSSYSSSAIEFRPRMRSKYLVVKLGYTNADNYKLQLFAVRSEFRVSPR